MLSGSVPATTPLMQPIIHRELSIIKPNHLLFIRSRSTTIRALLCWTIQILKLLSSDLDILQRRVVPGFSWRQTNQQVGIGGELDDEQGEVLHFKLEMAELLSALWRTRIAAG